MPQLKNHLLNIACPEGQEYDVGKWDEFKAVLETTDLETALNEVRLPDALTGFVAKSTWDYLAPLDYKVFEQVLTNRDLLPLTKLFRHLFNSTHNEIHIVTPNYDRIAEYAADSGGFLHYTGFLYGHIRARAVNGRPKVRYGNSLARTVNIWKVHGSLDWFQDDDGVIVGLPISTKRPSNVTPAIITPGNEKYRRTHDEPFHSIKMEADKALQTAESYLCIGYGFNDRHLQTTLVERCRGKDVPLVLLTKEISTTAKSFLSSGKCRKYLAIEEAPAGARVYTQTFPNGQEVEGNPIWQLGEFLKLVMS
jgi:hypothetical protein